MQQLFLQMVCIRFLCGFWKELPICAHETQGQGNFMCCWHAPKVKDVLLVVFPPLFFFFFPLSSVNKYFPALTILNCLFMYWMSEVNLLGLRIQVVYYICFLRQEYYFRLRLVWSHGLEKLLIFEPG